MTDLTRTYWQHTGTKKIVRICGKVYMCAILTTGGGE